MLEQHQKNNLQEKYHINISDIHITYKSMSIVHQHDLYTCPFLSIKLELKTNELSISPFAFYLFHLEMSGKFKEESFGYY